MIDWTKPIQTRDGRKAVLIAEGVRVTLTCLRNQVRVDCGIRDSVYQVSPVSGRLDERVGHEKNDDIINVPEPPKTRYVWLNVYEQQDGSLGTGYVYTSRKSADVASGRVGRMKITLEKGRWDE